MIIDFFKNNRGHYYSCAGNRFNPTFSVVFDEKGVKDLEVSGKVDTYAEIQSHADSVDINIILERFANGDINALNRRTGVYLDLTDMPRNYTEVFQLVSDATDYFEHMPVDFKSRYNNSVSQFLAAVDNGEVDIDFKSPKNGTSKNIEEGISNES